MASLEVEIESAKNTPKKTLKPHQSYFKQKKDTKNNSQNDFEKWQKWPFYKCYLVKSKIASFGTENKTAKNTRKTTLEP